MEKISRKGFLKVAAATAMSGVTAGALAACNSAASSSTAASGDAIYTPGTYTASADGIGTVKITATFESHAIAAVDLGAVAHTHLTSAKKKTLARRWTGARANTSQRMSWYPML